ncbi:hypothetical protein HHI36_015253, partial [Cryptolaemus montrouzieri]
MGEVILACIYLSKPLLDKLESCSAREPVLILSKSYLRERSQIVEWRGQKSENRRVTRRVPKASMLGHILFIIYINDRIERFKSDGAKAYVETISVRAGGSFTSERPV